MSEHLPKTRKEAVALGLRSFFSGEPCKYGHVAPRLVKGHCTECDTIRKREQAKVYREKNKEKLNQKALDNYARNPGSWVSYRAENRLKISAYQAAYRAANKARRREHRMARRAILLKAIPAWSSELDVLVISEAHRLSVLREQCTGIKWHVDHMIPLKAKACCGLHCAANVQVIPGKSNIGKGNKMIMTNPLEWLRLL